MKTQPNIVFGVPIDGPSAENLSSRFESSTAPTWIVTANPEILLEARQNREYAAALRQADVRTVDGFGLWFLLRLFGVKTVRVTGIDLAERLIRWAADHHKRVAFIGGIGQDTSRKAMEHWLKKYPSLQITAEQGGSISPGGQDDAEGEDARHRLTSFAPDVLFVAFGHPKQERWIARHLSEFPKTEVAMGVGGTFDVWAGNIKRAPKFLRAVGLEWLWRLFLEPKRIGRIFRAVVVFPILFLVDRRQ